MSRIDKYKIVKSSVNNYVVFTIPHKKSSYPVILDYDDFQYVKQLNKSWHITENGKVTTKHKTQYIGLNEIVNILRHKDNKTTAKPHPLVHINRLGIDNRRDNIIYDSRNKDINKNLTKKSRSTQLPAGSGINPDNIPTYIWYIKADKSHGDRFNVVMGDINWKTTSSSALSTRYKLEEAKKFVRELKIIRPDLFEEYSMNGDLNKYGAELMNSFYKLTSDAGIPVQHLSFNNSDKYLKEDLRNLTSHELKLLKAFTIIKI